jgi:hypothetical protein
MVSISRQRHYSILPVGIKENRTAVSGLPRLLNKPLSSKNMLKTFTSAWFPDQARRSLNLGGTSP